MNALAGAVTAGSYLRGNGTNVVMNTIQAADVPTLNQNTTGSSGSCTGNSATATTATNQSGGTVSATDIYTSGNIRINNSSPTITFSDTDQKSAFLHNNSNLFYILGGPINSSFGGWAQVNSQWPAYWDLTNNNVVMGGAIYAVGDVVAFSSDERLKTKTGAIENALDKVCSLTAFKYTHNDIARQNGFTDDKVYVGLSAQEVQKVLPEVIMPAPFDVETDKGVVLQDLNLERIT